MGDVEILVLWVVLPHSITYNPFCHYRSTGGSVSESRRLQSWAASSSEVLVHSLGVGPLPGERGGLARGQRQAVREEEVQKQTLEWQRRSEGKSPADAARRVTVHFEPHQVDEAQCTMNILACSAPLWLDKCLVCHLYDGSWCYTAPVLDQWNLFL